MKGELVLATGNTHKRQELTALLEDLGLTILSLNDFPGAPIIEEDGDTCEANAIKKAKGISDYTGLVALADDTGLEVKALGGRPGVYAARYAGANATYEDNCRKLLNELNGLPQSQRAARFLTVVAIADSVGEVETVEGELRGYIGTQSLGGDGFGYDPVFYIAELGKTLAELSPEHKNRISHRAQALNKATVILRRKFHHTFESGRSAAR